MSEHSHTPAAGEPGKPADPAPVTPAATPVEGHGAGHDHGHGHGHHHPNQGHHWDTMDQQCNAGKFGMWLFLATEVLLFAGLFCGYAVYRSLHPEVFAYASQFLDVRWGATNTVVLLISSFTVAAAVRAAALGQRQQTSILLGITLACAATFMVIKYIEYSHKFHEHLQWGLLYKPQSPREVEYDPAKHKKEHGAHADPAHPEKDPAGQPAGPDFALPPPEVVNPGDDLSLLQQNQSAVRPPTPPPAGLAAHDGALPGETPAEARARVRNVHQFFGIYFVMTGTHGLHVIIGALAILWVLLRNQRGDFSPSYNLPVDLVGLYWHLVDLIWIFLFPLLYLIDLPKWN